MCVVVRTFPDTAGRSCSKPLPRTPRLAGHYVFLLGAYRLLYIFNWVYRAKYEMSYVHHPLVYLAGLVQTLLYADFFYYYALRYAGLRARDQNRSSEPCFGMGLRFPKITWNLYPAVM